MTESTATQKQARTLYEGIAAAAWSGSRRRPTRRRTPSSSSRARSTTRQPRCA